MRDRYRNLVVFGVVGMVAGAAALTQFSRAAGSVTPSTPRGAAALAAQAAQAGPDGQAGTREVFSPDGTITRVRITDPDAVPRSEPRAQALVTADVVTIQRAGETNARFDLVFLGDGYTSGQIGLYHDQVISRWNQLTAVEPFRSLKDKFNVWQVNVVSRESGVDNDPTQGVTRDTALNSRYWCNNLDRLVCVDETAANQYAALAPAVDQVLVLVNSSTYGGSGGRMAVSSGGNPQSGDIVIHELGHSVGGLGDEYGGNCTYSGGEPTSPNTSKSNEATMRSQRTKWYQYLGRQTPDGGVIGTFEGAEYCDRGVYRPSSDSMMRSLGKPFNLIGLDAMTAGIMSKVR